MTARAVRPLSWDDLPVMPPEWCTCRPGSRLLYALGLLARADERAATVWGSLRRSGPSMRPDRSGRLAMMAQVPGPQVPAQAAIGGPGWRPRLRRADRMLQRAARTSHRPARTGMRRAALRRLRGLGSSPAEQMAACRDPAPWVYSLIARTARLRAHHPVIQARAWPGWTVHDHRGLNPRPVRGSRLPVSCVGPGAGLRRAGRLRSAPDSPRDTRAAGWLLRREISAGDCRSAAAPGLKPADGVLVRQRRLPAIDDTAEPWLALRPTAPPRDRVQGAVPKRARHPAHRPRAALDHRHHPADGGWGLRRRRQHLTLVPQLPFRDVGRSSNPRRLDVPPTNWSGGWPRRGPCRQPGRPRGVGVLAAAHEETVPLVRPAGRQLRVTAPARWWPALGRGRGARRPPVIPPRGPLAGKSQPEPGRRAGA